MKTKRLISSKALSTLICHAIQTNIGQGSLCSIFKASDVEKAVSLWRRDRSGAGFWDACNWLAQCDIDSK